MLTSTLLHNFLLRQPKVRSLFLGVLLLLLGMGLFSLPAHGADVTLAWDPPSSGFGGFILAYGTVSETYSQIQDVGGQTTVTVPNLNPGQTYFFAVKAYDVGHTNESPYSNEVSLTIPTPDTTPPLPPQNVQVY